MDVIISPSLISMLVQQITISEEVPEELCIYKKRLISIDHQQLVLIYPASAMFKG